MNSFDFQPSQLEIVRTSSDYNEWLMIMTHYKFWRSFSLDENRP